MGLITWIVAGTLLGGAAGVLIGTRERGQFALNVAIGVAGVLFGGWFLGKVIGASAFKPGDFSLASLLVSLMGAAVLLAALHEFRGVRHQSRRTDMKEKSKERSGAGRELHPLVTAGLAGILMLVGACASAPPAPQSALDAARVAISNADKVEAGQYAGAELGEARAKLTLAEDAVRQENMVVAERFAQESKVQAELASARTAAAKAASVNEEMGRAADALAEEMQRAGEP